MQDVRCDYCNSKFRSKLEGRMLKTKSPPLAAACILLASVCTYSGAANAKSIVLELYFSWSAYYNNGTGGNGIVYSKDVKAVTDPKNGGPSGSGYWCISPSGKLPHSYYVQTTIEVSTSGYSPGGTAVWNAAGTDCKAGQLEIETGITQGNIFTVESETSFTVMATQ
jgi:hypothetical protein